VADDDPESRALVAMYLERGGFDSLWADDGLDALRALRSERPDLIVLELLPPRLDGIHVTRIVKDEGPVPVLMLSARDDLAARVRGLDAGADDYLSKPFAPAELLARARALLRRWGNPSGGAIVSYLDLRLARARRTVTRAGAKVDLTALGFELLDALVSGDGRVLTRALLMDARMGRPGEPIRDRSIDAYVGRLRRKLRDSARQSR
jgi:DNA-binding response OmpR family regulator